MELFDIIPIKGGIHMKKLISMTLSIVLCFSLLTGMSVLANDDITVTLDGKALTFDVAPQIIGGSTMVPMRAIFEALGATVNWDAATKSITAKQGTKGVKLIVDSPIFMTFTYDASGDVVDNSTKAITIGALPTIVNNRTLVPVRAVSEGLGADVKWDGTTRTVTITSSKADATKTDASTTGSAVKSNVAKYAGYDDGTPMVPDFGDCFGVKCASKSLSDDHVGDQYVYNIKDLPTGYLATYKKVLEDNGFHYYKTTTMELYTNGDSIVGINIKDDYIIIYLVQGVTVGE